MSPRDRDSNSADSPDPHDPIGSVIAERYALEGLLGEGGHGVVYRARHVRTGRPVAVKLLRPHLADAEVAQARLEREARAATELAHPHVVEVLDFGEDALGRPYMVTELLQGRSLAEVLQGEGSMSAPRTLELLLPVAGALALAHGRGILHRDLKPENVFVVEAPGRPPHAKLLDFGIARVLGGAALTRPGYVVGTQGFMSPEQAQGLPLTPRSDQWALSVLMQRCLWGELPDADGDPQQSQLRGAGPALRGLQAVLERAQERDPEARYADVGAFVFALAAAAQQAGIALPASPDPLGLPDWPRWLAQLGDEDATQDGQSSVPPTVPPVRAGTEGRVLAGRYALGRVLGRGAMGVVHEAENLQVQRPCAVKVLHAALATDAALRERFRDEAKRAGRIVHEHVVAVTDYGVDGDTPFLVMELLQGESLRALIERVGALPVERARDITIQMVRGLAAAHALGIVHRDLKPENVFITRRADGSDLVKILDFGVAKALVDPEGSSPTQAGALLGTVRYMAPEQLRSASTVDVRADLYSAGLILYEMLAGRPAFDAPDVPGTMHQLLNERPPSLAALRPGLPAALLEGVERAIDPERSARPRDAEGLMGLLGGDQDAEIPAPAKAIRAESLPPGGHPGTRGPGGRAVWRWSLSAAVLAASGLGAWAWGQSHERAPAHRCAALPATKLDASQSVIMSRIDSSTGNCFWMDQTEVTVAAYDEWLQQPNDNIAWDSNFCSWKSERSNPRRDPSLCEDPLDGRDSDPFGPHKPMRCVDFCDAEAYCRFRGKRLCYDFASDPSTRPRGYPREWRVACSNDMRTTMPWGDTNEPGRCRTDQASRGCTDSQCGPQVVGRDEDCGTAAGVLDLLGNVAEWTYACNTFKPESPVCLTRGGGYLEPTRRCNAEQIRPASARRADLGFRCCDDLSVVESAQLE